MGTYSFFDNLIFIRKYRNKFHVWFEQKEQDWVTFFKLAYDDDNYEALNLEPKKLIVWEE